MANNIEQKIIAYECNLIKQAFYNKEVFAYFKDAIPENFFQNILRETTWKVFLFIDSTGEEISRSTVEDVFATSENAIHIEKVWDILKETYPDEDQWEYQLKYLYEIYSKANLLKLMEETKKKLPTSNAKELIEFMLSGLAKYEPKHSGSVQLKSAAANALSDIVARKEGRIAPFIKTGNEKFDLALKMDFNEIILFAAAKKIGKTKFVLHTIMEALEIDPSIAVKIYSFELSEKEIMYEFISRETMLTSNQIQSKGYDLTDEDITKIKATMEKISHLDIEIWTRPVSIEAVKKEYNNFCKKRNTNRAILIIDNIGLLKESKGTQTEIDDRIAKTLVEIKDFTKSLIIPIHHMTKEMEKEDRLKDGYRPRLDFLKGSTRIQDYANKVVLFHRPGNYEDLVKREESKGLITLSIGRFNRKEVISNLFIAEIALNRNGDKGVIRFLHKLQYCLFKEWR